VTALRSLAALLVLTSATPALAAKKPLGIGERIDISRAGVSELMRLPNVGRKKAEAIVAYRSRTPLRRVEDLLSVKGVSPSWLEKQRPHLTVGAAPAPRAAASDRPAATTKGK
jgi:competence protein ComEA